VLAGSAFVVEADMIVKALGQEPLMELFAALPELRVDDGKIKIDPATGATSVPGLFAGGDCISKGAEIVNAVQEGQDRSRRDRCVCRPGDFRMSAVQLDRSLALPALIKGAASCRRIYDSRLCGWGWLPLPPSWMDVTWRTSMKSNVSAGVATMMVRPLCEMARNSGCPTAYSLPSATWRVKGRKGRD
jgi:hypothetical protein